MKKSKKEKVVKCPYCGSKAVLRAGSYVHGEKAWVKQLYVCANYPECDSYVGVHEGTGMPKGMLANSELRNKRIVAHRVFDAIWQRGIMNRDSAYRWMQDKFSLNSNQAHIGNFSDYMCECLIKECNEVLSANKIAC